MHLSLKAMARANNGGQPPKYKPQYCEELIEEMSKGLSFAAFAGKLRVERKTLYNWKKKYPEFKQAHAIGKSAHQYFWEQTGIDGLYTISEHDRAANVKTTRSLNSTVYCAIMNNGPWREGLKKAKEKKTEESADAIKDLIGQFVSIVKGEAA